MFTYINAFSQIEILQIKNLFNFKIFKDMHAEANFYQF